MSSAVVAQAVEDRLRALNPTGLAVYVNEEPRDSADVSLKSYIVLVFPGAGGKQITLNEPGLREFEEDGMFILRVRYVTGELAMAARQQLDQLTALFRGEQFDGVSCYAPAAPVPLQRETGLRQGLSCSVPYYYRFEA